MAGECYWFIRTTTTYEIAVPPIAQNQAQFNRDVSYAFSGLAGATGNAGDMMKRGSARAVANFILCDGTALSRIGFPQLFEDIGTSFGAGDGVTTFNIPTQAQANGLTTTTPPQTVEGGTVTSGTTQGAPGTAGQTGGVTGGPVDSGGRTPRRGTDEQYE